MSATKHHAEKASEILGLMDGEDRADWLRFEPDDSFDEELHRWVERALTQLVLAVGSEEVIFAQAVQDGEKKSGRLVLFTPSLVVVAEVENVENNASRPRTTVLGRASLRRVTVLESARIILDPENMENRHRVVGWPGEVQIEVDYDGLPAPLVLSGAGISKLDRNDPGAIIRLLVVLTDDLRSSGGA